MKDVFQPLIDTLNQQVGIRIMLAAIKRFALLGHKTHAAALTYTTLFALVPLLTVTYSVLSMIPALQQSRGEIEQLLLGNLVPASGDALMGYLYQFSEQARQLTTIGIVLLLVTAFMMLRSIENSFNQVWQLKEGRKGLSSFLLYWAILSLGPLMLSAGLAVSSYIVSLGLWKEDWVPSSGVLLLGVVIPYLTSFLAFTLIYWAVPNCKVPLKHAAIGGAFVALIFEIGQEIFAEATTFFPSYQLIYGAFAAVPLFLLWLFISWSVILLGAEIVFLLGRKRLNDTDSFLRNEDDQSSMNQDVLGLNVINIMADYQARGEGLAAENLFTLLDKKLQNTTANISRNSVQKSLSTLVDLKLLIKQADEQYYLIRDLNKYSLYDYAQNIPLTAWPDLFGSQGSPALRDYLSQPQEQLESALSTSLSAILIQLEDEQ